MNDLLKHVGTEDRADSRVLADRLQNHHKNVLELIERYPEQMERFGKVAFKTEPCRVGRKAGWLTSTRTSATSFCPSVATATTWST